MPSNGCAGSDIEPLLGRLRDLDKQLTEAGTNKHDRVHMLINACITEGIATGPRIIAVIANLGFKKQHAGIVLKGGMCPDPDWPNWGRHENGLYYVPPAP